MTCSREPYAFRRNMSWAWCDIKRVIKHWDGCNKKQEAYNIAHEIYCGIFRIGK